MLLYSGSGPALASYRLSQRVRGLTDCAKACGEASRDLTSRLVPGPDGPARARLMRGLEAARDCAELCSTAAALMGRASELTPLALLACAEACRRCVDECESLPVNDAAIACVALCRRGEEICRQAAGPSGATALS